MSAFTDRELAQQQDHLAAAQRREHYIATNTRDGLPLVFAQLLADFQTMPQTLAAAQAAKFIEDATK